MVNGENDKSSVLKSAILLLSVCFFFYLLLELIDIMVYGALAQKTFISFVTEHLKYYDSATSAELSSRYEQPSSLLIARFITLVHQGAAIFVISFLIIRKKKYDKRYWIPALLIVLIAHNIGNPRFYYAHDFLMYSLSVIAAIPIGIFSIYLSTKIRTSKR